MTDKETLFIYRLNLADETLMDAEKLLKADASPRSIVNRAYYSVFYAVLALFIKTGIRVKTSKHTGVLTIFDTDFINTSKIEKDYSEIFHKMFDLRQKSDYKDFVQVTKDQAQECIKKAGNFITKIRKYIDKNN